MSITEREAVIRERAAWAAARLDTYSNTNPPADWVKGFAMRAAERYPLPKIQRQRTVRDTDGIEYRSNGKVIDYCVPGGHWRECALLAIAPRVRIWADLLARPTEEAEDDGAAIEGKAND